MCNKGAKYSSQTEKQHDGSNRWKMGKKNRKITVTKRKEQCFVTMMSRRKGRGEKKEK